MDKKHSASAEPAVGLKVEAYTFVLSFVSSVSWKQQ